LERVREFFVHEAEENLESVSVPPLESNFRTEVEENFFPDFTRAQPVAGGDQSR
jgi:hypothetical protein